MADSCIHTCGMGLFGKKAGSLCADPRQQILHCQQRCWGLSAGKVLGALSSSALGEILSDSLCVRSNLGGNTINEVALDFWRAGRAREEIPLELLEQRLRLELQEAAGNSWACWGAVGRLGGLWAGWGGCGQPAELPLCTIPSTVCHTELGLEEQALAPPHPRVLAMRAPSLSL